jgi:alanine-glyoxylate transaminase/serine-glyoxylate transaminase/serine-pyruvate transaminase
MSSASNSRFFFDPPRRVLMGPGPSVVADRVLAAMARPTVGYLDQSYLDLMEETQVLLRSLFRTRNEATFAVTGAGTAAMECALYNTIEPGERAVVGVHGFFGDRMRQILERAGAEVSVVSAPWGKPVDPAAIASELERLGGARLVAVVHGETSTGVCQPVREVAKIAHDHGAMIVVDTVASLGGVEFLSDEWDIDVVYSGAQKCLSVPPGISPITFGQRAVDFVRSRKTPCRSWYGDLLLNLKYWERPHAYNHTGPINLTYALYEGLKIVEEEGLDKRVARTTATARALWAGLEALGLRLFVAPEHRLPTLTTVLVPDGIDEAKVRQTLMQSYGIEIVGGLGDLKGRAWRVGLMGESCSQANVVLLLGALEGALRSQGHACKDGAAVAAATSAFESAHGTDSRQT